MNGISVFMGLVDIVPVVLFLITNLLLMKSLYNKLSHSQYALLSSGAYMLFFGGICKIIWKFLYALNICDYTTLTECFFPMQSIGFILLSIGLTLALKNSRNGIKKETLLLSAVVVPVVTTHMPFLLITLIAMTYFHIILCLFANKLKCNKNIVYFILSFAGMMVNCFVGVKTNDAVDNVAMYHWIAELSHIFAELFMLVGVKEMIKCGLAKECYEN